MVLLGLLTEGGHLGVRPLQNAELRQPLSSRHLTANFKLQFSEQQGP